MLQQSCELERGLFRFVLPQPQKLQRAAVIGESRPFLDPDWFQLPPSPERRLFESFHKTAQMLVGVSVSVRVT